MKEIELIIESMRLKGDSGRVSEGIQAFGELLVLASNASPELLKELTNGR